MKKLILILMVIGTISLPLQAADLPDYYPGLFSVMGKLEKLAPDAGVIVIADQEVRLTARINVYTLDTRFGTLQQLREGMLVGANPDRHGNVQEIWVLPRDFTPAVSAIPLTR